MEVLFSAAVKGVFASVILSEISDCIIVLCVHFQSKIHAARSLSEIAIDLTETGTLKTSKLANMGSKGKIISGSSGSLLSSGKFFPGTVREGRKDVMRTV